MPRTKIEINPAISRRLHGLDDMARVFFPDNPNHQRAFIAIWVEIKYADRQFLPSCKPILTAYQLTARTIEIVRAKMKKLGLIRRISHFNPEFGQQAGWTFSPRFGQCLQLLIRQLSVQGSLDSGVSLKEKDKCSLLFLK